MATDNQFRNKERLTRKQKEANGKKYYKDKIDLYATKGVLSNFISGTDSTSPAMRMQVNYDLFNNKINREVFQHVCHPMGYEKGKRELPAKLENKDISSGPIKTMLGMESKRAFSWKVLAVNPEATTRREQEELEQFKSFIYAETTGELRKKIEIEKAQQMQGEDFTPEDEARIAQEIEAELETRTPEHIKKYMKREYQDPAELQATHLLNYLSKKTRAPEKFNDLFKHGLLVASELGYVGEFNGEPEFWTLSPKNYNGGKNNNSPFMEDQEWGTYRHRMNPSKILRLFRSELTEKDIDEIFLAWNAGTVNYEEADLFTIRDLKGDSAERGEGIDVIQTVFTALRKVAFLTYYDEETDDLQETMVDEEYEFNAEAGDVRIEYEWYPEKCEGWKIMTANPIYVKMQPIPGQFRDIENLGNGKLPFYGVYFDGMESEPTSFMDRYRNYQYYYNIIIYRLELLIASDRGKKVLMNIGAIPTSQGVDVATWQNYFDTTPFMYYDPTEEGSGHGTDAGSVAKVIDLSVVSDIQKYIEVAEYIRKQAGTSVGITDTVLGQIGPREAVSNTQQALVQSSHILEMYFETHNLVKRNILTGLLECAKVCYRDHKPKKLMYTLDDMSVEMFDLDINLLESSDIGLFVENSSKIEEDKQYIQTLAHAAMQNEKAELSDILSILRNDSLIEAKETLKVAEERKYNRDTQAQESQQQAAAEESELAREFIREEHEMEKELIILKEEEKRKTVAITGMSFNPDVDTDGDGINDFLEIARYGVDADVKKSKAQLDRESFEHKRNMDIEKDKNDKEKIKIDKQKVKLLGAKNKVQ